MKMENESKKGNLADLLSSKKGVMYYYYLYGSLRSVSCSVASMQTSAAIYKSPRRSSLAFERPSQRCCHFRVCSGIFAVLDWQLWVAWNRGVRAVYVHCESIKTGLRECATVALLQVRSASTSKISSSNILSAPSTSICPLEKALRHQLPDWRAVQQQLHQEDGL